MTKIIGIMVIKKTEENFVTAIAVIETIRMIPQNIEKNTFLGFNTDDLSERFIKVLPMK
ncbi:hypothetical protein QA597_08070 [Marinilabiliaceae bacterium ANBcel2]|nr:hypothetical protein [Marinilabiliaceae bacterium ANBcel2]